MKLTTNTNVSVDGVVQGLCGPEEDRGGGFERGGWAMPLFDDEAETLLGQVYQRADAFLFGRRTLSQLLDLASRLRMWRSRWSPQIREPFSGGARSAVFETDGDETRTWSQFVPHKPIKTHARRTA